MLEASFNTIGVVVRRKSSGHHQEIAAICKALQEHGELLVYYLDSDVSLQQLPAARIEELGEQADLIVSVGGDGTLLTTTRLLVDYEIPIIGINLGRLGFLADVMMTQLNDALAAIFAGEYRVEKRFLLQGEIQFVDKENSTYTALNDIVLHSHETIRMIEFEVFSDGKLINRQRADGLIVTTPTGSTAYSLSAGGPIMHPTLQAMALVPISPHTLSNRPIVLPIDRHIEVRLSDGMAGLVSYDGINRAVICAGDTVRIERYAREITLLHPSDYHYFHILRAKLNWSNHP